MNGVEKVLPISRAQAGLWISEKAGTADVTFNLAEYVEIHGPISPGKFQEALHQLTAEVEATRLRIREVDGQPSQVILGEYPGDFAVLDFCGADDPRGAAEAWMMEDLLRPLDLAHDNLWAGALLKVAPDRWFWQHRVHHIAYDGFAAGLIARRLAELYTALQEGRPPAPCEFGSLEELLETERAYRSSSHFERDRAFWRDSLQASPPPVSLTKHRTTPAGGLLRHSSFIQAANVKALEALARSLGASLPQALIALVAAYYAKAADCQDLTIATMVTSRMNGAMRRIPGMMANAVPLRFNIASDLSWQDLVKQVSRQMMRALRHQRYRIEDMRRDLGLVRPDEQIAWLGVNIEPFDYALHFDGHPTTAHNLSNGTMNDFTIFAYDRGDGGDLRIDFDANAALYSRAELIDHEVRFTRLMDEILAAPDRLLRDLDLLSAEERRLVLTDWNDTAHDVTDTTWPQLFREQAARHPEAVAVVFGDRQLSYGELDAASDQWACVLIDAGVAAGDLVAVAVPRSEQMVVALLAVLKTGAAYLPLDLADPAARVGMILEDAQPTAVITTSEVASALPDKGLPQVLMDRPRARPTCGSFRAPAAEDIAYVIFTSGSTGRPKGVQIPHRALTNFLCAMQDLLQLNQEDRLLAVTTIAFDIAGLELFLPLLVGARTVIASREVVREPAALCRLIRQSGITVMQATPSLWRALLAEHLEPLRGLRPLVGGEALPPDLARRMAALGHPVWNLYGPTETTVWSTATALAGADLAAPPIGRPILNTRAYVLDRHLRPVPPGFPGELFLGGRGVGNGYLNRPDLTAERFLLDPFSAGGGRIYRTGDLARWRADGVLEYLGRNDHQIKIRGFRIEPGEIEAALVALPEVREAVVILREDPGRDKRLVAYLVLVNEARVDGPDLSRRLSRTLPGHMIPAAYVTLDSIPLNVNGKIDRRALPPPQQGGVSDFVAPRTETEMQIAEVWREILGIEEVCVHASFFDLGGDSLAAAAMLSGLRNRHNGEIPLGAVFETPTIASLAAHLEGAAGADPILDPVLTIRAEGQKAPLFCIHPVLGLGWGFHSLASHIDADVPIYALQSEGLRDLSLLPETIEDMAQQYLARIRQIQPTGPYNLVGWSLGGVVAHEIARQLRESDEQIAFLGLLDSYPYTRPAQAGLQDEPLLARAALGFLGFDTTKAEAAGAALTLSELGDFLFEQYDLDHHPLVQQIRQDDPEILDRARAVILHHLTLAMRFVPGRIDVDMHFFCAAQDDGAAVQGILNNRPEAWLRHVGGRIYRRRLNCAHQEMLDPGPAAEIGAEIQAEIRREVLILRRPVFEAGALTA